MKQRLETTMFITPVPRTSVQGRSNYSYISPDGKTIPAGRSFAKGAQKRYTFPRTRDGFQLKTGLSRLVPNPWYGRPANNPNEGLPEHYHIGADYVLEIPSIVEKKQLTKQQELEIRFNKPAGYLTNLCKLIDPLKKRSKDDRGTFLEEFHIILYDEHNQFDNTTLRGCLAMELAEQSGRIAPNKAKANPSKHHFYVSDKNEAAIERAAKQDIINDAIADLTIIRRQYPVFISYQIAVILGLLRGEVAPVTVKNSLNDYITTSRKDQMSNIESFNRVTKLLDSATTKDIMWIEYVLQQAVNNNVLRLNAGHYIWPAKKGIQNVYDLGTKKDSVIKFFLEQYNMYVLDEDADNYYKDIIRQLSNAGVKLSE